MMLVQLRKQTIAQMCEQAIAHLHKSSIVQPAN